MMRGEGVGGLVKVAEWRRLVYRLVNEMRQTVEMWRYGGVAGGSGVAVMVIGAVIQLE